jgi:hypothetical protein
MKNVPLLPRPVSWLSAVLLYLFLAAWMTFLARTLPPLLQLYETSPRLAALGLLALWISPIPFVAVGHHIGHAFLDRADRGAGVARGVLPGLGSLWAGVLAWLVLALASSVAVFFLLVLFPPPPADSLVTMFAWPFDARARAGLHTAAWVLVAAQLYDLERAIMERAKRGDT